MSNAPEIVVGGLYATRSDSGTYRVSKVLGVGDCIELRCGLARFPELPATVGPTELAGPVDDGPGAHFAILTPDGFWEHEPVLVGVEAVRDGERLSAKSWWGDIA
jgi:hypothetical protein